MLEAILASAHNGIIAIDAASRIVVFNRAAERLTGIAASEALGRPIESVLPESDLPRVLRTGRAETSQRKHIRGRTVVSNRAPIIQDGRIIGAVAVFQDLSELESISAELETTKRLLAQLESVIESSYDGIYLTDGQGITLRVNRAYEEITGFRASELVGRSMRDLVAEGYFSESVTLRVLAERKPVTITQRLKSGKEVLVSGSPVFDERGEIVMVVTNVRDITRLNALQRQLQEAEATKEVYMEQLTGLTLSLPGPPVARSAAMREVLHLAARVARYPTTVLIQGETGVGKEVVAGYIHRQSPRRHGPLIKVNCGGIPPSLAEAELFGYQAGAFTGASSRGKPGLVELADGGTLVLDEVDSLPPEVQVKLLRVLQDREVMRLGATQARRVDVRIIALTNKDLEQLVNRGAFREDLYYRLNVVQITIPPLRERPEDVEALLEYYLDYFCHEYGVSKRLSLEVRDVFRRYQWPGNVRELRNLVENLVVSTPDERITMEHLPRRMVEGVMGSGQPQVVVTGIMPLRAARAELERQLLTKAVETFGSLRRAARYLGMNHATLARKVRRLDAGAKA